MRTGARTWRRRGAANDALGRRVIESGQCTNEWQNGFVLTRHYDAYGRNAGYALNGVRQTAIGYDTYGRISTMLIGEGRASSRPQSTFVWSYLPGTDLKQSLVYPNGLSASWDYDANNQLLQVKNAVLTNVVSQYDYTYDAAGRRIEIAKGGSAFVQPDSVAYGYNARSELTNAVAAVDENYRYGYRYDPIGNREMSSERGTNTTYAANELNQYTAINTDFSAASASPRETFTPQFDDDGNQTLVKTATGIWSVTYNGENRPILWQCLESNNQTISNQTIITMAYDHMGRRRIKNNQRFVYDGYLQVANFHSTTTTPNYDCSIWDPTEPIATRPLVWQRGTSVAYYTHDGNKNVSEVIASNSDVTAHYEYAPFGAVVIQRGTLAVANTWRFSSEFADDELGCDYYNYREYEPVAGRWMQRDLIDEIDSINLFLFIRNRFCLQDVLGLKDDSCSRVGVFNVTDISIEIIPRDNAFDRKGVLDDANDLLERLAKIGFFGTTKGLSNLGLVLRLIYAGADYYSRKKVDFEDLGDLGQALDDFSKKYLEGIFRIDGRLEFELCMCRNGKLCFVNQESILDSEEVDFGCIYDFAWYKNEINRAIKSVEKELLKKLGEKVKEVRCYE